MSGRNYVLFEITSTEIHIDEKRKQTRIKRQTQRLCAELSRALAEKGLGKKGRGGNRAK